MSEIAEAAGDFHAFPTSSVDGFTQHGMTFRDYIATAALQGIGTWVPMEPKAPYMHQVDLKGNDALKARAEWSYRQADAMLRAREA